jgi:hypothetical protein
MLFSSRAGDPSSWDPPRARPSEHERHLLFIAHFPFSSPVTTSHVHSSVTNYVNVQLKCESLLGVLILCLRRLFLYTSHAAHLSFDTPPPAP